MRKRKTLEEKEATIRDSSELLSCRQSGSHGLSLRDEEEKHVDVQGEGRMHVREERGF